MYENVQQHVIDSVNHRRWIYLGGEFQCIKGLHEIFPECKKSYDKSLVDGIAIGSWPERAANISPASGTCIEPADMDKSM